MLNAVKARHAERRCASLRGIQELIDASSAQHMPGSLDGIDSET